MTDKKKVVTGEVRASYVNVFEPRLNELSGNNEYSMKILILKNDVETLHAISEAQAEAIKEKWGDKPPARLHKPLRDGDAGGDKGVPPSVEPGAEPYGGHFFMSVKSTKRKPQVINAQGEELDVENFGSGDYCRVSLRAYCYDLKTKKGVTFGLGNIQLTRKGEPLGFNPTSAHEDFGCNPPEDSAQSDFSDLL